jgi:hypothetical protein
VFIVKVKSSPFEIATLDFPRLNQKPFGSAFPRFPAISVTIIYIFPKKFPCYDNLLFCFESLILIEPKEEFLFATFFGEISRSRNFDSDNFWWEKEEIYDALFNDFFNGHQLFAAGLK